MEEIKGTELRKSEMLKDFEKCIEYLDKLSEKHECSFMLAMLSEKEEHFMFRVNIADMDTFLDCLKSFATMDSPDAEAFAEIVEGVASEIVSEDPARILAIAEGAGIKTSKVTSHTPCSLQGSDDYLS